MTQPTGRDEGTETERQINQRIAAWMGGDTDEQMLFYPTPVSSVRYPPFTRSLDSMALAEARFTGEQYIAYIQERCSLVANPLATKPMDYYIELNKQSPSVRAAALVEVIQSALEATPS